MNKLRIDFGPAAGRPRRHFAWLLAAAGLAACAWPMAQLHPLWQQRAQQHAQWQQALALRDAAAPAAQAETGATPPPASAVQAEARLRTPWHLLFVGLESAAGAQVVLLGVEADAQARELRIQSQAQDLPALLAYVDRLAQVQGLAGVRLESSQVLAQHPQRPVDGLIVARWQAAP